eukprot:jgi/Hompol1/3193/HPOL_006398-RA
MPFAYGIQTSSKDDFEFKRLLLTLTHKLAAHPNNLAALLEDGLLSFMIMYCDPNTTNAGVKMWSESQLRCLRVQ